MCGTLIAYGITQVSFSRFLHYVCAIRASNALSQLSNQVKAEQVTVCLTIGFSALLLAVQSCIYNEEQLLRQLQNKLQILDNTCTHHLGQFHQTKKSTTSRIYLYTYSSSEFLVIPYRIICVSISWRRVERQCNS